MCKPRAQLFVGNDSGPLHPDVALGVPTVGIYWRFNAINGGHLNRTRHYPTISWRLRCPRCDTQYPEGHCVCAVSFVANVPHNEVLEHALELYGNATVTTASRESAAFRGEPR